MDSPNPDEERSQSDLPLVNDASSTFQGRQRRRLSPIRPQEPATMNTAELVARFVGSRHRAACEQLTAQHSSLREIAGLYPAELHALGFTTGAVNKLRAVFEIAKRFGEEEFVPGQPFRGSADVYAHFRERLADEIAEHFFVILLD